MFPQLPPFLPFLDWAYPWTHYAFAMGPVFYFIALGLYFKYQPLLNQRTRARVRKQFEIEEVEAMVKAGEARLFPGAKQAFDQDLKAKNASEDRAFIMVQVVGYGSLALAKICLASPLWSVQLALYMDWPLPPGS